MHDKRQILCYGDSNTWGCIGRWQESPLPSERYDEEHRWPNVMQAQLGENFNVICEGLGGRTTIYPVPGEEWKSGESYLIPCLNSHYPLDLVVIMLGTNDLQVHKTITAAELPLGIARLVDMIRANGKVGRGLKSPEILLIAPVEIIPSDPNGRVLVYAKFREEIGRELSLLFPSVYAKVAEEKGCYFLNAQEYAAPGPADGVHLDPESHVRLGCAAAQYIREHIFPEG